MKTLNYLDCGNPSRKPTVFLHGFLSSNLQWQLNRHRLEAELRTIFIELPGHGGSPAPETAAECAPELVLGAIDRVRRDLDIDQWHVVGQSLGGAMGLRYTLAFPSKVRSVTFTNSRAAFGFTRIGEQTRPLEVASVEELRRLPFHPIHAKRFPEDLKASMVASADGVDLAGITHMATHSRSWKSADQMHELACPVLLVNGIWESAFQPHLADAQQTIADLTVVNLEGGHSINVEQPEAFDAALLEFLQGQAE